MRIEQQTSTQLIARNAPLGPWLGCIFLIMVGVSIFTIPANSPGENLSVQIYAYGFIMLGVVELLLSGKSIIWTFDKSESSLLVRSRSLFGTKTSKYALTEISKVQAKSRVTGESGSTFGIELVLLRGEKLQLCPGFTLSDLTAKEGVRRISSFLELR